MRTPSARPVRLSLYVLVLITLHGTRAFGESIPHGRVDLVAENQWIVPGGQTYLGFAFTLDKGWHIYWINPGDSGQPPSVQWHLPPGLTAGQIEWPAPRRLGTSAIVDFGYDDSVTLLVPLRSSHTLSTNQVVQIAVELKVLICKDICISGKARILLPVPIKSTPPEVDARNRDLFAKARKFLPRRLPPNWKVNATEQKDTFALTATISGRTTTATFFPLEESQIDNSAPQKFIPLNGGFELILKKSDQLLKPIMLLKGVLDLSTGQAYAIDVPVGLTNPH